MEKQLKLALFEGWENISRENMGGPATFRRAASRTSAVLQVSIQATYTGGKKPDPTAEVLIGLARNMVTGKRGEVSVTNSGKCKLGLFGAAQGTLPDGGFIRLWVLSNGYDFVLATQTSADGTPDDQDLNEGHSTIMNLDYR